MANPVIEAIHVSAGYGSGPVIRDIAIEAYPGEVVVLLGANGAGKTTTMLTMAGELIPSSGEVRWLGKATRDPLHKRAASGLRFVTEERSIFPSLTTADNLKLGGDPERALDLFPELEPLLRRPARLLSGGEQQILTLARALSSSPRLLLADELSLGLAPMIIRRLMLAVREAADQGVAVVLVEQQVRQALEIADRGYVLRRGRVVLSGSGSDLSRLGVDIERTYLSGAGPLPAEA